jgi:23S rRNA (guanine745-N1)-methyltransferase
MTMSRQVVPASKLACPIDGAALQMAEGTALRCTQGHSFDRAREGYYNLLVVQHKASRDPGDSRDMVAARRRILEAGLFAPIAGRVCEIVARWAGGPEPAERFAVVDAGCGEGYYLAQIAKVHATAAAGRLQLAGIDISKWAIQAAARRDAACFWAVASNRHLPFMPASVDLVLSMFGFPVWDQFAGLQPAGGHVLLVDPGPDHLIELRAIIYPEVRPTTPPTLEAAARAGYELADEQRLRFPVVLNGVAQIADLLAMTPHDHRAPLAGRQVLARLSQLEVTGDVAFRVLRRGR